MKAKRLLDVVILGVGLVVAWLGSLAISSLPGAHAAGFAVTNTNAGGPGSLRRAILDANGSGGHDVITFIPSISGTIVLTGTLPEIAGDLTITGPGAITLAISGDNTYQVLRIASTAAVTISGLTIRDGYHATTGGGIWSQGTLLLVDTDIVDNASNHSGGGLYISYRGATLNGGRVISNTAQYYGGGVYIGSNDAFTQTGASTITHNTSGWGGGIVVDGGNARLNGGQIVSNTATDNGGGVFISGGGSAILSGGQIVSNTASSGGGVYVLGASSAFTQTSASALDYNTASHGGGLYVNQGRATLSGGQIFRNIATNAGGGLYISLGDAVLSSGQIVSNTANSGGGVYIDQAGATFTQTGVSTITHNIAGNGGGIHVYWGRALLQGGVILSNTATTAGGGIYISRGSVVLSGGQILNNTAQRRGGGVYATNSSAVLTQTNDSAIAHNVALGGSSGLDGGGGIYIDQGRVTINGGQVFDNVTAEDGGGVFLYNSGSTLEMNGGQIISNTAFDGGGGLYITEGSASLRGAQVISNSAASRGGIFNAGTLTLMNTTISHNRATAGHGGGLYNYGTTNMTYTAIVSNTATGNGGGIFRSGYTVSAVNTIIADNSSPNCGYANGGTFISNGYNLENTDTCGLTATTDFTNTVPLLGPLSYEMSTWVHPLLAGSPAINNGYCVPSVTTIDQRGVTRPEGGTCDIGPYELIMQEIYLPLMLRSP